MRALALFAGSIMLLTAVGCAADDASSPSAADSPEVISRKSSAQVVLHFGPARKKEAIDRSYFKTADFTGDDIIAKDASTRVDIVNLETDQSKNSAAPMSVCHRGANAGVKKILEAMLSNSNGNGDHNITASSISDEDAAGKITVGFTTESEAGEGHEQIVVPRC